ncbi:hypothetical protein UCRPC4_g06759 [Phaeomoniella chlamydospora]|uniref:alpha-galactosidase n=1 Tax=Phaeomoniella chlamydospora TaxID=158046 RepID=A0A0G2GBA5_PHACM|nr:hypothetical protein UCRPC4_g06759 [Phaeomoniella chlamydospora]
MSLPRGQRMKDDCESSLIEHEYDIKQPVRRSWPSFACIGLTAVVAVFGAFAVTFALGWDFPTKFDQAYSWCNSKISETSRSIPQIDDTGIAPRATIWQPAVGTKWDYRLEYVSTASISGFNVLFLDLFDVGAIDITYLHQKGVKVVCYFSAGTAENWRSDYSSFSKTDLGSSVSGWAGEKYVDIRSTNVRNIMIKRLNMAVTKKCDGVDPDNVDSYANKNGKSLTATDATSYVNYLADAAHARGLAIGLKNAPRLISNTISRMQWSVQEQCHDEGSCALYAPFIKANKPVFNVEYPKGSTSNTVSISATKLAKYCKDSTSKSFSIIIKNLDLDNWIQKCS